MALELERITHGQERYLVERCDPLGRSLDTDGLLNNFRGHAASDHNGPSKSARWINDDVFARHAKWEPSGDDFGVKFKIAKARRNYAVKCYLAPLQIKELALSDVTGNFEKDRPAVGAEAARREGALILDYIHRPIEA
jgi:hypothetical protein